MQVSPPKYVINVLNGLNSHGYSAYLVGGCVRDILLNVEPNDWDIATSALPEQILEVFPDSLTIGMKHGTITVKQGKELVEVTTFRLDGDYSDHRHPEHVSFVNNLSEDLSRRDFTINAIAMDKDFNLIDPFKGQEDLKAGIIRAVGVADKRFEEDALRMFRAFRFSSRLGFEIEPGTIDAIYRNAHLSSALSGERVRDELTKVLLSDHPEYIHLIINCGLLDSYLNKRLAPNGELEQIVKLDKNSYSRFSYLCYILSANECIDSAKAFLQHLKLDGATIKYTAQAMEMLNDQYPKSSSDCKRLLAKYDQISVDSALKCMDILSPDSRCELFEKVLESGECCHIKDLDINGNDLQRLGITGKDIGTVMNILLNHVIDNPNDNKYEVLLSIAENIKEI